ncbi:MAG: hypothetical protein RMJ34_02450 [candidate division WOR-3 bacterium]|nr:hypothetical protein [candidate division WOR-3 bacterium]MDW8113780.1 hypothetical protein [candidate division WOR-3 bacterium]
MDCDFGERIFDNGKYLLGIKKDSLKVYNLKNWNGRNRIALFEV